eukprot:5294924-Alexandrium_andersonii.AAC.1
MCIRDSATELSTADGSVRCILLQGHGGAVWHADHLAEQGANGRCSNIGRWLGWQEKLTVPFQDAQ